MTASNDPPLQSAPSLAWMAGIAVILSLTAGVAMLMGWIPDPVDGVINRMQAPGDEKVSLNSSHDKDLAATTCARCGVIVSIRSIVTRGGGGGLGPSGGAVIGGLLGLQLGGGRGSDIAILAGAAGGAYAGNEIGKKGKPGQNREITVQHDDGSATVLHLAEAGAWHTGDHVKVVAGVLHRN